MNRREVVQQLGALALTGSIGLSSDSSAAPSIRRLSGDLSGKTVDIRDYCGANGRKIDTEAFQELLDLRPAAIRYPSDAILTLDKPVKLRGGQQHLFTAGARIEAETNGYALAGIGLTSQHLADVAHPISRYATAIEVRHRPDLAAGDMVLIADVADPQNIKIDANEVARIEEAVVTTRYPIGRAFADPRTVKLYMVYDPLRGLRLSGQATLRNLHPEGGGIRLSNTIDTDITGLSVNDTGYIGLTLESSLRARFGNLSFTGTGASGFGARASKDILLDGFVARGTRADESLTFYDNVSVVEARNLTIEQYTDRERNPGQRAGNNLLIDMLCSKIKVSRLRCVGSTTYNFMVNNQCDNIELRDFTLRKSNLGGIRVSAKCRNTRIDDGIISDVHDAFDQEARKPVSAITVGSDCPETVIGKDVVFERIASGRQIAAMAPT